MVLARRGWQAMMTDQPRKPTFRLLLFDGGKYLIYVLRRRHQQTGIDVERDRRGGLLAQTKYLLPVVVVVVQRLERVVCEQGALLDDDRIDRTILDRLEELRSLFHGCLL